MMHGDGCGDEDGQLVDVLVVEELLDLDAAGLVDTRGDPGSSR